METLTYKLLDQLIELSNKKILDEDIDLYYAIGYISATIDIHAICKKCDNPVEMLAYVKSRFGVS